jgi:broad specificity phosphatase PhoE
MSLANLKQTIELICVRHAESDANSVLHYCDDPHSQETQIEMDKVHSRGPVCITEKGENQARNTGTELRARCEANSTKWGKQVLLCCSSQFRAKRTCEIITQEVEKVCEILPIDWASVLDEETHAKYPDGDLLMEFNARKKEYGGEEETSTEFAQRIEMFMNFIANSHKEPKVILLVGHSMFISTILTLAASQLAYRPKTSEDIAFHLPNCSITHITYSCETLNWSVLETSNVAHLPNPTGMHYVRPSR